MNIHSVLSEILMEYKTRVKVNESNDLIGLQL